MREIDKKHIEETKNKKINEMVSEELADEDISAEEYEEAKKEICREYGTDDDKYLVNGAVLVCDRATSDLVLVKGQPIILTSDIGADIRTKTNLRVSKNAAYDKEQKVATVKDRELIEDPRKDTDKNIRPFMCNCLNQPNDEEADEILRNREYYEKNGTCCKLIKLRDDWENMIRDTNYQTFSYGVDNRVEEVEGITMLSMLFCSHGGLITPIDSGQETEYQATFTYTDKDGNLVTAIWNISDNEFVNCYSLTLDEIKTICKYYNPNLVSLGYADGIYNYCINKKLNPKVLLATLGQEQWWCKNGNYEKAFGVGPGGNPQNFNNSNSGILASITVFLDKYNEGLTKGSLLLKNINCDPAPNYPETRAVFKNSLSDWQSKNPAYVKYMEKGQDIECVNAAMYAKLSYTPWVDFPPQGSHPLEDWLRIYNSLEDCLGDE